MKIKICPEDGSSIQGGLHFDRSKNTISIWTQRVELSVRLDSEQVKAIGEALADDDTATVHAAGQVTGKVWENEE